MPFLRWLIDFLHNLVNPPLTPPPIPPPAPSPKPPPAPVVPASISLPTLIAALNAERAKVGLAALRSDPSLSRMSQEWASTMAARRQLDHGNFLDRITRVYPNTAGGEDIAEGQRTVSEVVADWMASPGHKANILGVYNLVGAGVAADVGGVLYWVVDFDRRG